MVQTEFTAQSTRRGPVATGGLLGVPERATVVSRRKMLTGLFTACVWLQPTRALLDQLIYQGMPLGSRAEAYVWGIPATPAESVITASK